MGHSQVFMPECHSTNDEASRLVQQGHAMEGTIVVTNNQTAGRGQRGNTWDSEPGKNLTFSIVIRPSFLSVRDQFYLNMTFSLGLYDLLNVRLTAKVHIKWPNDMFVNDKKICGILIENHVQAQHIQHSIVGIGLNVNQKSFSISTPTSMALESGNEFLLEELLPELLGCLEKRYLQLRAENFGQLEQDYHHSLYRMGEKHVFKSNNGIFEGTISGVDPSGRLKVYADGTTEYFEVKQIQFLK